MIVGLGNPGPHYRDSRHNLGFRVVDALVKDLDGVTLPDECGAQVAQAGDLLLVRPLTYMNRSGWAVRCLVDRHQIPEVRCLVVYDDVALPLGQARLRAFGGPGGHRGMASVVAALQSEAIARLRLGIRPQEPELGVGLLSDFVLAPFAPEEAAAVAAMIARAAEVARVWSELGIESAQTALPRSGLAPDPSLG